MSVLITLVAAILDWIIGDPQSWPHPVRFIGRLISALERLIRKNLPDSPVTMLRAGWALGLLVIATSGFTAWLLLFVSSKLFSFLWLIVCLYLTFSAICLKDLLNHACRVECALASSDLVKARQALSWIVGRDTSSLDDEAIRRAVVETLAENFSDGLVAPIIYLAIGGPVMAWIYKAINTLDSMVGYKNDLYLNLGRFSAKLDDVANYGPSRLAALLLVLAARICRLDHQKAWLLWRTQGRLHLSPNSGQTEAAMAGALGVFLGGSSTYGGATVAKPVIGSGGGQTTAAKVQEARRLVVVGTSLVVFLAIAIEVIILLTLQTPFGWGLGL
ncbi:MAG: adenosylcobinamide-phosphate synthase CbiB [Deltaproteobacteria bacterium]|nr:adenosylcobinamide-phosphate synthase CbiB [Deltaproteobacteria bacterium]